MNNHIAWIAVLLALAACGKASDGTIQSLSEGDIRLYITKCSAEATQLNMQSSTIEITSVTDGLADITLKFNFMKNAGITNNETCDIFLKDVPYTENSGVCFSDARVSTGTLMLGIVKEEIVYSDVTVSGSIINRTGNPTADLTIKGTAKERPLELNISSVSHNEADAGFDPDIPIVEVDIIYYYRLCFSNDTSLDCTVSDAKGLFLLDIPAGKSAWEMASEVVFMEENRLLVTYSDGSSKDFEMDGELRKIRGLDYETGEDFFLTAFCHKIEPYFYSTQHYHLLP